MLFCSETVKRSSIPHSRTWGFKPKVWGIVRQKFVSKQKVASKRKRSNCRVVFPTRPLLCASASGIRLKGTPAAWEGIFSLCLFAHFVSVECILFALTCQSEDVSHKVAAGFHHAYAPCLLSKYKFIEHK